MTKVIGINWEAINRARYLLDNAKIREGNTYDINNCIEQVDMAVYRLTRLLLTADEVKTVPVE